MAMSLRLTGLERQPGAAVISPVIPSSLELIKHTRLHQESGARTAMLARKAAHFLLLSERRGQRVARPSSVQSFKQQKKNKNKTKYLSSQKGAEGKELNLLKPENKGQEQRGRNQQFS